MSTPPPGPAPANHAYPSGLKLALLLLSIFLALFLVALDRLIIATAVPQITNQFHTTNDIGWYGAAYLITNCAFSLVFGKLYKFMGVKGTFLAAVALFEIGSAICGAAPNSVSFIVGRAIAGLGAGGVQSGVIVILVYSLPLEKRPKFQGLFGAVFGLAFILGPLVGGAFTTHVTWRWCFYINLPLGALVMLFIFFLLHVPDQPRTTSNLSENFKQLNLPSILALVPGVVSLCLALQWGGFTYAWESGRIVALLVVGILLLTAFAVFQVVVPRYAIVPPRIFVQRSIASAFWVSCCVGAHQTLFIYYLPVWFQAIKGDSAVQSGIHTLPMVIALVLASILTGGLTSKLGYYTPFLIGGVCLSAIGTGLLYTFAVDTSKGMWIGYQILYGFGLGLSLQAPNMAAQTVLAKEDVSIGASLQLFGTTLSGAIFVAVGQNVLSGQLTKRLGGLAHLTPAQIQHAGITGLYGAVPTQLHEQLRESYNASIRSCFLVGVILACITIFGALTMEWLSVKSKEPSSEIDDHEKRDSTGERNGAEKATANLVNEAEDADVKGPKEL